MPHPDLALELLAFLQRREPRSLFPLSSIRIADLPEHLRSDDLVNYCQHHSLVESSWIPKDAPNYSPETAGLRLSIGEKGAADLAEWRLTDRTGTADEAAVAAAPARSPAPPPGPIRSETRSMTSNERFRQLTIQHSDCLDQIQKEWQRADETMLEFQIAGMGRETGGYEKIAAHERGMARSLVTDYHDKVIMPLLPHVDELLQRELIAFADRLYDDVKDPRRPWSTRYRERRSKLDRLLGARVQAEEIAARDQAQQSTQQDAVPEAAALPQPHVGDDLFRLLADQPDQMSAVIELPDRFQDPDMLTVSDDDGLIEFGTRKHCWVGPVGKSELRVEKGWNFSSITGPNCKSMDEILAEALTSTDDGRIRLHVRLTAKGRIRVARLKADRMATVVEPKTKTTETDWRDIQRRLERLRDQGEKYTTQAKLAVKLNCSPSTINKAISRSTKLNAWKAESIARRGNKAPPTTSLTEVHLDNLAQPCEQDPAEAVTLDDPEEVLAHLIQDAEPKVRAKLNAITPKDVRDMTGDQIRNLVGMICNDPDKYNRVLGRKP